MNTNSSVLRRVTVRLLAPLLACGAAMAVETPKVDLVVNDGARLIKRWEASIYAKLWNERALESARQAADAGLSEAEKTWKVAPRDLLTALRYASIRVGGFSQQSQPLIDVHADIGKQAQPLFARARELNPELKSAKVAGALEALVMPSGINGQPMTLARFGSRLSGVTGERTPAAPATIIPGTADVSLSLDYLGLWQAQISSQPQPTTGTEERTDLALARKLLPRLQKLLGPLNWEATLVPEGIQERVRQDNSIPGLRPVDRTVFSRLPANTMMAFAIALDSAKMWPALEPVVIDALAVDQPGLTRDQFVAMVEKQLADTGLPMSYADLTSACNGTVLIAVTPAAPFPAVTIALPRSKSLDQMVQTAAKMGQVELPKEGTSGPLAIPDLPVPLSMIVDKGYWVLTSDPQLATSWNAKDKGWSTSPAMTLALKQAGTDAAIIGASDTAAVLRTAGGFAAVIPFLDQQTKQTAAVLLARAAEAAGTGYIVGSQRGKTLEINGRGMLGVGIAPFAGVFGWNFVSIEGPTRLDDDQDHQRVPVSSTPDDQ